MNPQDYNQNPYGAPQNPQGAPQLTPEQIAQMQGFYGAQNPQVQFVQPQQGYPQPQMPIQPAQNYPQSFQPAPQPVQNFTPQQQANLPNVVPEPYRATTVQAAQVENPYTVDYLNRIAPKEIKPFWTTGKKILAAALGVSLVFALILLATTDRGDDDREAGQRIYFHLQEAKTIAQKYQKKIKSSDLSADNAGIATSLTSDEETFEKYLTEKKIQIPKTGERKKNKIAIEVAETYSKLDKTIEDAYLSAKMDEIYSREFGYQLVLLQDLIAKYQKSLGSKSREKIEPIIKNLDGAITKFDGHLKNAK